MFYVYNGRTFKLHSGELKLGKTDAWWFNPAKGTKQVLYKSKKAVPESFDPPGETKDGNDWVLIIEKSKAK